MRQAKHLHVSLIQEIEEARARVTRVVTGAWARLESARAQINSDRIQIEASKRALGGVRDEEEIGQRTLLDVLNAEQEYLDAQVQLVISERNLVVAGYAVLAAIGRLSGDRLAVSEQVYDPEAHYRDVRRKWWGVSITHANGRREQLDLWETHGKHYK